MSPSPAGIASQWLTTALRSLPVPLDSPSRPLPKLAFRFRPTSSTGASFLLAPLYRTNEANPEPLGSGGLGTICPSFNGFASCSAGLCSISACSSGFELVNGVCQLINYLLDNNNCGGIGLLCRTPSGASSASCLGGSCVVGGCLTGFTVSASGTVCAAVDVKTDVNNWFVLSPSPSQLAC